MMLTTTGYTGRHRGRASYVEAPPEWRGTTVQVCGLWPFGVGAGAPTIGTPVGTHLDSQRSVCFDPVSWFSRARLLSTPITYMLGRPGLGKSSLARRMVLGTAAQGVVPLVLGDLRPDYTRLVEQLGGQVVRLGRGLGALNPLDAGVLGSILHRLPRPMAEQIRADIHGRRLHMVSALIEVVRRHPVAETEETILSAALRVLDQRFPGPKAPLLQDLIKILDEGPSEVRSFTLDRGDDTRYRDAVDPLHRSLLALIEGPLGDTFARPTTTEIDLNAPAVAIDISGLGVHDTRLTAAVLLTCWNAGFAAVEANNKLADAGREPQKRFLCVLDELWRVLRAGAGLVDRLDELTRINREWACSAVYITHSGLDAESLERPEDRAKARGFIERAGAVVCFGLPKRETADLSEIVQLSAAERDRITRWSAPPSWDFDRGEQEPPPGRGKALIKVGDRPGIPMSLQFTPSEQETAVHDTNQRWH